MTRFPTGLAHLIPADLTGSIEGIAVRPKRREAVELVNSWDLTTRADHSRSKKRAVTLISEAHIHAVASLIQQPDLEWSNTRRNLLVRGVNVNALRGRRFRIGDEVVLEGTQACHPCSRMVEVFGPRGYAAMMGMGGLCAAIIRPGTITIGDTIELLPDTD